MSEQPITVPPSAEKALDMVEREIHQHLYTNTKNGNRAAMFNIVRRVRAALAAAPAEPPLCPFCQEELTYEGWSSVESRSRWRCASCNKKVEIDPFLPSEGRQALVQSVPEVDTARRVVEAAPAEPEPTNQQCLIRRIARFVAGFTVPPPAGVSYSLYAELQQVSEAILSHEADFIREAVAHSMKPRINQGSMASRAPGEPQGEQ